MVGRRRNTPATVPIPAVCAIALATARAHLDDHPAVAASRALRLAPAPLRRVLAGLADRLPRWWGPLALAAAGRREAATASIVALAATSAGRVPAAAAGYALHDGAAARHVLDVTTDDDATSRYARALSLRTLGFLEDADAAVAADDSGRARRLRQRLRSQLTVLAPEGREPVADPAPPDAGERPPASTRVLHLVTNALPETQAGYTTRTQGIVRALTPVGVAAAVAPRTGFPVLDGRLAAAREVEVDGVRYLRSLPWRFPSDVAARVAVDARERAARARDLDATVLHAHSSYPNARAALAIRDATGLPVVYEVRGMLEETWRSRGGDPAADQYRLARASETEAMRAADAVVVISEVLRAEVIARGVPSERVTVVPNAVDDAFLGEVPDPASLRRELGLEPDDVVVGTISTLNDYEGLDVLVDAVGLLREQGRPVRLLVVGAGPAAAALRGRAASLGDAAVFPGRVPFADVRRYHAAIDVFAVPRLDLPVTSLVPPLKPLEAMASGRPVVASDLPPLREIVDDGVTGLLAPAGDAVGLAAALGRLVDDPAARADLGGRARAWVRSERTWHRAAERYRDLYATLGDR